MNGYQCIEIYDACIKNMQNIFSKYIGFRNSKKMFSMDTSIIRSTGGYNCGENLLTVPTVDKHESVFVKKLQNDTAQETLVTATTIIPEEDVSKEQSIQHRERLLYLLNSSTTRRLTKDGVHPIEPSGNLENIREYATKIFSNDQDQMKAFELIVAAFIVQYFQAPLILGKRKRSMNKAVKELQKVNNPSQFVAFLSGQGGTGKSRVIHSVLRYCKRLCENANIEFNRRTITVTALTGAAAVSIFGETTHSACLLNASTITEERIKEWQHTKMVIIDEISFASERVLSLINKKLNILKQTGNDTKFGNIPILFAGDFTQLEPVGAKPLFVNEDNELWYRTVTTFIELKTNHRFCEDIEWGDMLARIRTDGASATDLQKINSRVVCTTNNISESDIPEDAVYATSTNVNKAAINDGIFLQHLRKTHSTDEQICPPDHTICIKASNIKFKTANKRGYNDTSSQFVKDTIYATCSDGHVKDNDGKHYDPMLKLYKNRRLCINQNYEVENCIANGAMCKFKSITFKDNCEQHLETIIIDGYYVHCIEAEYLEVITVEMIDGNRDPQNPKIVELTTDIVTAEVKFPMPWDGPITKRTMRIWRKIKFDQFPLNVADARTGYKLQGRSVTSLVISNWDYKGNWVYVVLSRCSTLKGIYLRCPLLQSKPMSDKCKWFHMKFREEKQPPTTTSSTNNAFDGRYEYYSP